MSNTELVNHVAPIVTSEIDNSGDEWGDNSMLRISVKGVGDYYGFTVHGMPEEQKEWLKSILTDQITTIVNRTYELGRQSVIKNMKALLELK